MADTYYSRLTIVNPQNVNNLDPRGGVVIAETAATGRFVTGDINWENLVSPNFQTSVAYNGYGDIKIFEPMGFTFFDYIRAAAFEVGCDNHLDARFLLEIEILAEDFISGTGIDSPFKYIWPIMLVSTDVKSSVSEKGSEYVLKFIHANHHSQTDLVQPIKDTTKVKAGDVKTFFKLLSIELENKEYKYAEARQKAGGKDNPGTDHPASLDDFHDEYHFLVQPDLEGFTFTSKGKADPAVKEAWFTGGIFGKQKWDITARPGTTIISWINRVLMSTKEVSDLLPGKKQGQPQGSSGSSDANKKAILDSMGKPYQFFRIETYTVNKNYDYIRGRYAVKHVFLIFLADQPNMYHYPDELDLLNNQTHKNKVVSKLKYYVQEGLLRKVYYHNYTGLNTDIIKVDLQFNQSYSLPSFPVVWTDRGQTGPGQMNLQNYRKDVTPFVQNDKNGVAQKEIKELRLSAAAATREIGRKGTDKARKEALEKYIQYLNAEIVVRENELRAKEKASMPKNSIKNRTELLETMSTRFAEDVDFKKIYNDILAVNYSGLRPRMEPDVIGEDIDVIKAENEKLMEKIFTVLLAPRDLVDMELEIMADPYWLGMPNVMLAGKNQLSKIEFSSSNDKQIKALIEEKMPALDTDWGSRINAWGDYGQAQQYKGANLFYFNSQAPTVDWNENDTMSFNTTDQILGIYQVWSVTNSFKDGKWTQKLKARKDLTIPSYILPRGSVGNVTFEQFMQSAIDDPVREADKIAEIREKARRERNGDAARDNLPGGGAGAGGVVREETLNASTPVTNALATYRNKLANDPNVPVVNDPVKVAENLMASNPQQYDKEKAYSKAKEQYIAETKAHFEYTNKLAAESYAENGITNYKPYPAETLKAEALQKSGTGGLNDWYRNNTERPGPAAVNNPAGLGFDARTGTYTKYETFNDGVKATTEYYNFGAGVQPNQLQGTDRMLLPSDWKGSPSDYIIKKSKRGNS